MRSVDECLTRCANCPQCALVAYSRHLLQCTWTPLAQGRLCNESLARAKDRRGLDSRWEQWSYRTVRMRDAEGRTLPLSWNYTLRR